MPQVKFKDFWSIDRGKVLFNEIFLDEKQSTISFFGTSEKLDKSVLDSLQSAAEISKAILSIYSAWSFVYYRPDLRILFIGRDLFGRLSLVCTYPDSGIFYVSSSVQRDISDTIWIDVPYGQVSAINVDLFEVDIFSYLEAYPDDQDRLYREMFPGKYRYFWTDLKPGLLEVSPEVEGPESPCPSEELFQRLIQVTRRLLEYSSQEILNGGEKNLAIAFSGGVDSLLVAHGVFESTSDYGSYSNLQIDLVNVAFGDDQSSCSKAPDRVRGLLGFSHLKQKYPNRKFRLILADISETELHANRPVIAKAATPSTSVLDDSLACVLWFILRGTGLDSQTHELVSSPSKLYFVGSGADELFAGYGRHRTRYDRDGHSTVAEECALELRRLGSRNGGRDARVAAQHGKLLLSPFLEESIVGWANSLPILSKCDLSLPRGKGEKKIIREALIRLNSPHDAPKQAMQFGSRIAKMSNAGEKLKGSDISKHLS
ncbi:hypothetical protein WR25_12733 [Diploscapter pachys]|uniref:Asparagine synthetase domain-containing protein n=1 Tax=Diploscapter pachys TaxID=2018661 RepID=A0A2A2JVH1_9BILA|nr:hypothetical protein WR25_12733 [Diploscapter pachys]